MDSDFVAVILAAGLGKRMKSSLIKGLHPLLGRPIVWHVIQSVRDAGVGRVILVVGHQEDRVRATLGSGVEYVTQKEQLGTGHALLQTQDLLQDFQGDMLVLYGDTPLLTPRDLGGLMEAHRSVGAAVTILTAVVDDPTGYGRIVRGRRGEVENVVEEKDATPEQLEICEVNTGIYCFRAKEAFPALLQLGCNNTQGEYYLTDVPGLLARAGKKVATVVSPDPQTVSNINDRVQLHAAASFMRNRNLAGMARAGVTVVSFETTFVDVGVVVGQDTVLYPMTFLEGNCRVGSGCVIGPNVTLRNTVIGDDCRISYSVVEDSRVGSGVTIGPFAHLRPGSDIRDGARIGNFTELKNALVDEGSKIPHHSYIGDTRIGKGVNIGAGTVTVNYDGRQKHSTSIEDGAFIGCNANLIAPVTVGAGAYVAAGSTINQDVPAQALAVARNRQVNKEGWAAKNRGTK
ncbi:MAG: bifunctional UDP-N-acetylglucosamine diphosphorylase/glucosamine-1-phosphate N-acetyltransferase GlmU [Bacillota bacterium]